MDCRVISRKVRIAVFNNRGKSFINNKNNAGPNIDPCGTPDRIVE